jgi:hypothetical protein
VTLTIFLSRISTLDTRHILLWCFLKFVTNWPIILWHFSYSSQIISPFVMFYKIRHGWRKNSPVSMNPRIVFCLCGMNISCWSHMSDLHRKLFYYRNIILYHLGGPHDTLASGWPTCQLSLGRKECENGVQTRDRMVIGRLYH